MSVAPQPMSRAAFLAWEERQSSVANSMDPGRSHDGRNGLPPLLFLLVKTIPGASGLKLMETVKDGQLCWFALTLCCSIFCDLMQNDASTNRLPWCGGGMAGIALLGGLCSLYAVVAALKRVATIKDEAVPIESERAQFRKWVRRNQVFLVSAVMAALTSVLSFAIHEALPR